LNIKLKRRRIIMGKIAFMFPGQGAQYIGMGKDFYDAIPVCREMFELAGKASGLDVAGLCFEENDKINITEYTQIAMLAAEVAILKAVEDTGVKPDVTAGLSLGEYGALAASGVMSPEDVFKVVRQRGIYMQEAVPTGGAMTAVLGLDASVIEKVCEETEGIVSIANYNCPGQIVITGEEGAVAAAAQSLTEAGAKRCVPLKVSGPFHSQMLADAGDRLGKVLEEVAVCDIQVPYIANVTADYVTDKGQVKELLTKQVSSSVRWEQTIRRMIEDGVDTFIEIGPGKTLSGFMRKISREVKTVSIEKLEDLQKLSEMQ
jgi:[acyl-carrier-protein] S-malonyltransferase